MKNIQFIVFLSFVAFAQAQIFSGFLDIFSDPITQALTTTNFALPNPRQSCNTTLNGGSSRFGVCMLSKECRLSSGQSQVRAGCPFGESCCIFQETCNQTTNARVSYFTFSGQTRPSQSQVCTMRVELENNDICQIRVDILSMTLADTVENMIAGMMPTFSYTCTNDRFYVEPTQTDPAIPPICGKNSNQHFYIHLNQQQRLSRAISLNVLLSGNQSLIQPNWDIKVTQLECPGVRTKFQRAITFDNGVNINIPQKRNPNQAAEDFSQLAPAGCLQYYTAPMGTITNFGWSSAADSTMASGEDYAICFKRQPNSCGVTLTSASTWMLRDADTTMCMQEYVLIPEEVATGTRREVQVCMFDATMPTTYTSNHPGPLYIHVHTDPSTPTQKLNPSGFSFMYNTNVACPTT